jgi:hypothetical protein
LTDFDFGARRSARSGALGINYAVPLSKAPCDVMQLLGFTAAPF